MQQESPPEEPLPNLPARALKIEPLPTPLSSYLGREALREETLGLLASTRLLTLVGTGGVGKTRLALETLRAREALGDTVVWVELSALTNPDDIPLQIVAALGLKSVDEVIPALRNTPILLGLDNCEHLIHRAARKAQRLLLACPDLRILATSREPLNLPGETVLRLPGLSEAESALLFSERAQRARPGWLPTRDESLILSLLCLRLDGLPLALELAAAKLRTHSLPELMQRLEARLSVLTSGNRVAEPRQQTLHAAIAWSYELLSEAEKTLFVTLAVFQGGWTSEDAGALCGDSDTTLERLDSLVDKSLVQINYLPRGTHYLFLETIRAFAHQKLEELPTHAILEVRRHHLDVFFAMAQRRPSRNHEGQLQWAYQMGLARANLGQALEFCRADQPQRALEFCNNVWLFWGLRGDFREQRRQYEVTLALPGAQEINEHKITALREHSNACQSLGDWAAARASLDLLRELNIALGRPHDSQTCRALLEFNEGNLEESRKQFEEVLLYARAEGTRAEQEHVLANMGQLLLAQGKLDAARALILEYQRFVGDSPHVCVSLALLNLLEGNLVEARKGFLEVLTLYRELESYGNLGHVLVNFAMLLLREGKHRRAAQFFGMSYTWCDRYDFVLEQPERGFRERDIALLQTRLGTTSFDATFREGTTWSTEQVFLQLQS